MTLNIVSSFNGVSDPDAAAYIEAVEAADNQLLEFGVGKAINDFVLGCKADGIWDAIKASCILAGARTRQGALIPLANASGVAPTFNGTAGGWNYNRKTGLAGNGTDNYINSGRNSNADPQDNVHQSIWISSAASSGSAHIYIGAGVIDVGTTHIVRDTPGNFTTRNRSQTVGTLTSSVVTGFAGHSRSAATSYVIRGNASNYAAPIASETPYSGNVFVFSTNPASFYTDARLAFYSIGEALDLAKLDSRVTDLITAFGAAIP